MYEKLNLGIKNVACLFRTSHLFNLMSIRYALYSYLYLPALHISTVYSIFALLDIVRPTALAVVTLIILQTRGHKVGFPSTNPPRPLRLLACKLPFRVACIDGLRAGVK